MGFGPVDSPEDGQTYATSHQVLCAVSQRDRDQHVVGDAGRRTIQPASLACLEGHGVDRGRSSGGAGAGASTSRAFGSSEPCTNRIHLVTIAGFIVGLAITLAASELLARGLTRLGTKMGFSEGLLGLLAALGADSPELSSAVIAILAGAGSVGVGVVVGSNLFNLAALLGLSALVAGGVRIRRAPLVFDAAVGLLIMGAAAGMVAGVLPPAVAALLAISTAGAYAFILAVPRKTLRRFGLLMTGVPHHSLGIRL